MCQVKRWMPAALIAPVLALGLSGAAAAQEGQKTRLELKKPIARKLGGAERHVYQIALKKGQFIHLVVEQRGVDVVVTLYAPGGEKLLEVDSPNGTEGPEPVFAIAEESGQYRVEVASLDKDAPAGNYEIRLEELRAATAEDRRQIARLAELAQAVALNNRANELYGKGKYAEAGQLYQQALALDEKVLGGEHPTVANDLTYLAMVYQSQGDYARALPLYQRALAIFEKALGSDHPDVANALSNVAGVYQAQGDYARALPLLQRSLAIVEKALSGEHPLVGQALGSLGMLYYQQGDYRRALPLLQRALAVLEKALGREHLDVADALTNLAALYQTQGDHGRALELFQRALAIYEKALGSEHLKVATASSNVAMVYQSQGDYARALPLFQRTLAIREEALGSEHPDVATSLNNLAMLYDDQGDYGRALPLLQRALAIQEKALGREHPAVAQTLKNLAGLYYEQGDYGRIAPLLQRALAIDEKALGGEHPDVATSLNNLAMLYYAQRDYARALPLFQRALAIYEKVLGAESTDVANVLSNLGMLYYQQHDYGRALPLQQRALAVREKVLGGEHPDVAISLSNLAVVYDDLGDYARALPLYQRALAIDEKMLGGDHPDVGKDLNNIAMVYSEQGDYGRALPLLRRSLGIQEKALGGEHPEVAQLLDTLAKLYFAQGDYGQAISTVRRAAEAREKNISSFLQTGSQQQKQIYLDYLSRETSAIVAWHTQDLSLNDDAARLALTTILRRKGRALDAFAAQLAALRGRATPADRALLEQLAAARARSATLILKGQGNSPEVKRLEAEAERLEDAIGRSSAEFRAIAQPVTLEGIAAAVPPDGALVELIVFKPFNTKAMGTETKYGAPRYAAYVLRRGDVVPRFADLGEAAVIDADVERLREALKDPRRADVRRLARALDERVMRPVRGLLGPVRRVFLSPDGALNLVPFAALVDEDGKYLIENYSLTYLTSGRDLLRLQVQTESRSGPVLVADPLYDVAARGTPDAQATQPPTRSGESSRSVDFAVLNYKPLPGTAEEAAALGKLLPDALTLTEERATEAALKQVNRPRVLHIATHGFFLPDQPQAQPAGNMLRRGAFNAPAGWENPLLRSGLVLAGVKQGLSGAGEDGVLTALEAAGLDLWGTKLVVLSACETGLGAVKNGEGVYGLRRALVLAGSETQVMSLWKVSDAGTRDLMVAYYTRLQRGEGRTEALRQVQLAMLRGKLTAPTKTAADKQKGKRETGEVDDTAPVKNYRHPYYWASFIPSGNWRNLDGQER